LGWVLATVIEEEATTHVDGSQGPDIFSLSSTKSSSMSGKKRSGSRIESRSKRQRTSTKNVGSGSNIVDTDEQCSSSSKRSRRTVAHGSSDDEDHIELFDTQSSRRSGRKSSVSSTSAASSSSSSSSLSLMRTNTLVLDEDEEDLAKLEADLLGDRVNTITVPLISSSSEHVLYGSTRIIACTTL
jgi:hypothetical protein